MAKTRTRADDGGKLRVVPWTEALALRAAGVDADLPRPDQEAQLEAARDEGRLPEQALRALRRAGWRL